MRSINPPSISTSDNTCVDYVCVVTLGMQHQLDTTVEILDPLERDYDQLSYGELCYNCVAHREDSHPRFVVA